MSVANNRSHFYCPVGATHTIGLPVLFTGTFLQNMTMPHRGKRSVGNNRRYFYCPVGATQTVALRPWYYDCSFALVNLHGVKLITRIIDWLLYTSAFAAMCALGMCMATERLVNTFVPPLITPLHVLVTGSTLLVYNVHHIIKRSRPDISDLYQWSQHYKFWHFLLIGIGFLMCASSIFFMSWKIFVGCAVLGALSFAYSVPLLPFKNKKRLRDFGWIKILDLTSVWTIVTSVLPILYWDRQIKDYPYEIVLRFVFMFTLCVAFDIRDMQTDLDNDIYTLPNVIGLKNSYRLMNSTIILFALLSIVQYIRHPQVERLVGELLSALVTKIVINYSRKHPSDKVYLGLVDGMMLLYAVLVLLH